MRVIVYLLLAAAVILGLGTLAQRGSEAENPVQTENAYQTVSAEQAWRMITRPLLPGELKPLVIDVCDPVEYDAGHVPGAVNIPLDTIEPGEKLQGVENADRPLMVYCRNGVRADRAARRLALAGYHHVYNFRGIRHWPYELVTDGGDAPAGAAGGHETKK